MTLLLISHKTHCLKIFLVKNLYTLICKISKLLMIPLRMHLIKQNKLIPYLLLLKNKKYLTTYVLVDKKQPQKASSKK